MSMIKKFFDDLIKAYGALYLANGGLCSILLFLATMTHPLQGLIGMMGGATALLFRRTLKTPEPPYNIDVMNAVFISLALAKIFEPSAHLIILVLLSSCITILFGRLIQNTLRDQIGLPVLSLPFVLMSWLTLAASPALGLTHQPFFAAEPTTNVIGHILQAFGALYFNPDYLSGSIVLLGFFLLSPILVCLGLLGYAFTEIILLITAKDISSSMHLIASYNGIVTAIIIGGILGIPRKQHMIITLIAVTISTFFSIAASALLSVFWLPVFSFPFILASYLTLLIFRGMKAPDWARYWLPLATLPEKSLDRLEQHDIRGLSQQSVALYLPFRGSWDVYQGVNGEHTHQGIWRHGADFFKTVEGLSFSSFGTELSDYYCYGLDVYSPVYGYVVDYRDDVDDNYPGYANIGDNWGNYIIISINNDTYVILAHLQKNSIKINKGSFIDPQTIIGKCGNSGRSLQPHLHIQVQKSSNLGDPTTPFHFAHVLVEKEEQRLEFSLNFVPQTKQRVSEAIPSTNIKEAVEFHIGNILQFNVTQHGKTQSWHLSAHINLIGTFFLATDKDARVFFYHTERLLALDGRHGKADPIFDALLLGIGLTPYSEQTIHWHDSQPIHLIPLPRLHRFLVKCLRPFGGGLKSEYQREWCHDKKLWLQGGIHSIHAFNIIIAKMKTEIEICEASGLIAFNLCYREKNIINAQLSEIRVSEDLGLSKNPSKIPKSRPSNKITEIY